MVGKLKSLGNRVIVKQVTEQRESRPMHKCCHLASSLNLLLGLDGLLDGYRVGLDGLSRYLLNSNS